MKKRKVRALPPSRDRRVYSREFWSTALTLVLLAAVVALAAVALALALGRLGQ